MFRDSKKKKHKKKTLNFSWILIEYLVQRKTIDAARYCETEKMEKDDSEWKDILIKGVTANVTEQLPDPSAWEVLNHARIPLASKDYHLFTSLSF